MLVLCKKHTQVRTSKNEGFFNGVRLKSGATPAPLGQSHFERQTSLEAGEEWNGVLPGGAKPPDACCRIRLAEQSVCLMYDLGQGPGGDWALRRAPAARKAPGCAVGTPGCWLMQLISDAYPPLTQRRVNSPM